MNSLRMLLKISHRLKYTSHMLQRFGRCLQHRSFFRVATYSLIGILLLQRGYFRYKIAHLISSRTN